MIKSHFVMFESNIQIEDSLINEFNSMSYGKHLVILGGILTKLAEKYYHNIENRSKSEYLYLQGMLLGTPHLQVFLYDTNYPNIEEYFKQYRVSKLNKVKIDISNKTHKHIVKIILKKLNNLYSSEK